MECLSPRLGSKDGISVLDENDEVLNSSIAVGADQTIVNYPSFALPEDLDSSGYVILIGCNFTGYTQFVVSTGGTLATSDPLLLVAGIGLTVVLVAIVVVIFWKKRI